MRSLQQIVPDAAQTIKSHAARDSSREVLPIENYNKIVELLDKILELSGVKADTSSKNKIDEATQQRSKTKERKVVVA